WCNDCESSATSTDRSLSGSFVSCPFFQVTFVTWRRSASAFARSSTSLELSSVAVRVEVLLAQPQDLLHARLVRAHRAVGCRRLEVAVEHRPERALAVAAGVLGDAVIDESRLAFLGDEPGVLQQAEMPRDVRLRDAQDARQLGDVEPVLREDPEQPEARGVGQEPEEGRGLLHIYKSTYIDTDWSTGEKKGRLKAAPPYCAEAPA